MSTEPQPPGSHPSALRADGAATLVLTQNEVHREGPVYADRAGVQYEFPSQYRRRINEGDQFVYYRGRRGTPTGQRPHVYVGVGVVGAITDLPDRMHVAEIACYEPFYEPVDARPDGEYIEEQLRGLGPLTGAALRGNSVRVISRASFDRILELADAVEPAQEGRPTGENGTERDEVLPDYPSSQRAREIDEAGMLQAVRVAEERWPHAEVKRKPHNNPGFDIEVLSADGPWFVEVKSTGGMVPRFFLSEGERRFDKANAGRYSLLVLTEVDPLWPNVGSVWWHEGDLALPAIELAAHQWLGQLIPQP